LLTGARWHSPQQRSPFTAGDDSGVLGRLLTLSLGHDLFV
jgi:hypothetical protein